MAVSCTLVTKGLISPTKVSLSTTIYSKIILVDHQNKDISIDCRPSDAIILAIKSYTRIFIESHVIEKLENSDIDILTYNNSENLSQTSSSATEIIQSLHSALEKAIDEEEYEIAAKIRDRIKLIDLKK